MKKYLMIKPAFVIGLVVILLLFGSGSVMANQLDDSNVGSPLSELVYDFTPSMPMDTLAANASFYFTPGSTFLSVTSSQSWAYDGMGCIHNTTDGSSLMNMDLQLPNGSRIVLLRVYYDDTLAATGYAWITIYPEGGTSFQDLVAVPTLGSSGHGSNYGNLDHIVDNYNQSYVLNWRANTTGPGMQLCGIRVMYYRPTTNTYMPMAIRQ